MDNLFYSESEKIVFWVAGYLSTDGAVDKVIEVLKDGEAKFREITQILQEPVKTANIHDSTQYKGRRVF